MHFLDFFSIIERDLSILNPSSHEKLMLLADYSKVRDGSKVLDIASGKGYMLRQWAKMWAIEGTGLELNPTFIAEAKQKTLDEGVQDRIEFIQGDAKEFEVEPESYDVVTCIGASFAIGSTAEALAWMHKAMKPNGVLALGEVFLLAPLPSEVAELEESKHYLNLLEIEELLEAEGLTLTGLIGSSTDNWDRYAGGAWRTAHAWARDNPEHPDRAEVLKKVDEGRKSYLRFTRPYTSWGIFVAQLLP